MRMSKNPISVVVVKVTVEEQENKEHKGRQKYIKVKSNIFSLYIFSKVMTHEKVRGKLLL